MAFRTTSAGRLSKLIGVSAKVFSQSVAGVLTARPQLQTRIRQAKAITEALSELKGASMKFGQILSAQGDAFLPPEVTEILSKLQNSAPAFSGQQMYEIAKVELGDKVNQIEFDLSSLAAASIGQVHRIRLKTGEQGVMKIQYPGIDKAISSEVALLKRILHTLSQIHFGELAVDLIVEEVKCLLMQEVDYSLELKNINQFRELLADDQRLIVPTPFAEFSTSRVLSMSHEKGLTLKELLTKSPSQEARNEFGNLIFDLYMREVYKFNFVQTDPNFANYLFRSEGAPAIVLFDFGACKTFPRETIENYKLFVISIRDKNKKHFLELCHQMGFLNPEESEKAKDLFWEMCLMTLEPIAVPGVFDFGNSDLPKRLNKIGFQFLKQVRRTSPPKDVIFLNRKIGGVYNLLRTLGVKQDFREMVNEYLLPASS